MLFSHSPIQATWQSRTTILVNSELKSDQEWMISSFVSGSSKGGKDHEVLELSSEMCLLPQMSVAYCANENKEVFSHFSIQFTLIAVIYKPHQRYHNSN